MTRPLLVATLLAVVGCREAQPVIEELAAGLTDTSSTAAAVAPAYAPSADRGRTLVAQYECARCHQVRDAPPVDMMKGCVGCHESIGRGTFPDASDAVIAEWQGRMHSLPTAPSLDASGPLLSAAWVAAFLVRPHDLRPDLEATMPRLALGEHQAQDIAAFLTSGDGELVLRGDESAPSASRIREGAALFEAKQCGACHAFATPLVEPLARDASALGVVLAPDLRWTRDRVRPERLAAWMRAPKTKSAMPHFDLTEAESEALASLVMHAPLEPPPEPAIPQRLPALDRPVSYAEVEERVFRKICWHCHAQPDLARGDGGPGMSGGMGFRPRHLDLSTYESINSGYLDDRGELTSLFSPTKDGTPRIVAVLLARRREVAGELGELRGMPLGFPALSAEDVQLVESWVAQGRPR